MAVRGPPKTVRGMPSTFTGSNHLRLEARCNITVQWKGTFRLLGTFLVHTHMAALHKYIQTNMWTLTKISLLLTQPCSSSSDLLHCLALGSLRSPQPGVEISLILAFHWILCLSESCRTSLLLKLILSSLAPISKICDKVLQESTVSLVFEL